MGFIIIYRRTPEEGTKRWYVESLPFGLGDGIIVSYHTEGGSRMTAFFKGFGRALDLGANFQDDDEFIRDDAEAILSDWQAVGNDIRIAMSQATAQMQIKRPNINAQ